MSLLVISLYELKQFLQIIMWIGLPAALVTVVVTTILHYSNKKRPNKAYALSLPGADLLASGMDLPDNGEAYQNMLHLQKKYISEIELGHHELTQIKEEFKKLEKKYIELIAKNGTQSRSNFASPVFQDAFQQKENEALQLKASLLQLEETLRSEREQKKIHSLEINKLGTLLKDMEMVATKARQETEDQLQSFGNQLEETREKQQAEKKAWLIEQDRLNQESIMQKEENARLRDKLIERESAHDVIEEKNIQIGFLQNQLDNRIKKYHHFEYQTREDENRIKDFQTLTASMGLDLTLIRGELQSKSEQAGKLQEMVTTLQDKLNWTLDERSSLRQTLESNAAHIEYIENSLKDFQDRNSVALEQLNNSQIIIVQLNENLLREVQRSADLEHKLEFSNQLLMKIYKELANSLHPHEDPASSEELLDEKKESKEQEYIEPISLEFEMVNNESIELQN